MSSNILDFFFKCMHNVFMEGTTQEKDAYDQNVSDYFV